MADRPEASARAVRAIVVGVTFFLIGVILIFSPLLWGPRFSYNKYFVTVGISLALLGASVFLNGAFDWLRSRRS